MPASNGAPPQPTEDEAAEDAARAARVDALLKDFQHDISVTLADRQADPNSPLYSAKTFEELNLHPDLLKGVFGMGYQKPSKIQERALPLLMSNPPRNMIAQSQSGTGKTAAFVLAMLSRIDMSDPSLQALCLSPSRELADQTLEVVRQMGRYTGVKSFFAGKGMSRDRTPIDAQLVVGTPGTIRDLIQRVRIKMNKVKIFVIDEADQMLEVSESMGEQTNSIKAVVERTSSFCQYVCFSATFPDIVADYCRMFSPEANEIRLQPNELNVSEIKQFFVDCPDENSKYDTLLELFVLLTIGQSIIFCKTRQTAHKLVGLLREQGHKVAELNSDLEVQERDDQMRRFREGQLKVLVATNVVARGLDVLTVNMVVNYDLPTTRTGPDAETYLHRVGRTGRFGRQGIAINMVHDSYSHDNMLAIEAALGITLVRLDGSDYERMERVLKQTLKG